MNFLSPAEVAVAAANAGKGKSTMGIVKLFLLGILAGVYIGFGANLATTVGAGWTAEWANSGLNKFAFGAVFSVGLMMVVIGGSELFTGNNMFLTISALNGQATWGGLLYNWVVVWIANFVGSILLVGIVFAGAYYCNADGSLSAIGVKAVAIAKGKLGLTWSQAFFRAIGCNWLVCMAVWLALASKDVVGKILAIFFPIMAFVTSGFEHSVANMYFIPMGIQIASANPDAVVAAESLGMASPEAVTALFNYGNCFVSNLIPVTLGNIVGGGLFVAAFYWFAFLKKDGSSASASKSAKA
ncbi:MAG: formate/nitrite transporter family protein [Desulfitobacteriaceae bacterium]|nr:formate/nitrite transporter family protein [Desulfitobacteriaceae bacterium]MDD4752643.1 formate/nitrite transporter family protein [Desulfitobacteriaceae bacterium]